MFEAAQTSAASLINSNSLRSSGTPSIQSLPATYSLSQIAKYIVSSNSLAGYEEKLTKILILRSCLENSTRLTEDEEKDNTSILDLVLWLSEVISPDSSIAGPQDDTSSASTSEDEVLLVARKMIDAGLVAIQSLLDLHTNPNPAISPQILRSLLAFTSSRDSWTTPLSLSTTAAILSRYQQQTQSKEFIVDYVLQGFIRPLFSKAKPEAVTASGRKAMPSSAPRRRFDVKDEEERTRPWMDDVPQTVSIFEWAVKSSSPDLAKAYFYLYIPPLLTILDSTITPIRSRALSILATFIPLLPAQTLIQTGLAEVFEDAVTPTLMFLPNLTPVDESVLLLDGAYQDLIVLGSTLYSTEPEASLEKKKLPEQEDKRIKFWDRLIRKGILTGNAHANEHPAIVEVLLRHLSTIVSELGIYSVKHLKDIIPILTTILTDPFAPSRPSLLLSAITALQETMLNAWPRVSEERYRVEIISALVICWKNIRESECSESTQSGIDNSVKDRDRLEQKTEIERAKKELRVSGEMLVQVVDSLEEGLMERALQPVFAVDPEIRAVFGMEAE